MTGIVNSYNPPQSQPGMYPDDSKCTIPVSCPTDGNIQPAVEWGINWSKEHKMTLNLDETKAMLNPNTLVPTVFPQYNYFVTEWKFLGVVIDQLLNFNYHVAYVVKRAQKTIF